MTDFSALPETQPFFFKGSEVGVLVSHGFTGTTQSMRGLGEMLAREGGFTVSGPRLAGHGTRPEEMAQSTASQWVQDEEDALNKLREHCSTIFMTGLSMGGTLCLYMAGMHPEVFAGIIPINAAVFLNAPALAALALAPDAPPFITGIGSDIKMPGVKEIAYPITPTAALKELYALMAVTRELLERVICPTLIFESREDHVVPPANGEYVLETIPTADKRLIWLENSYHVATLDNDQGFIAEESLRFIRAHTP